MWSEEGKIWGWGVAGTKRGKSGQEKIIQVAGVSTWVSGGGSLGLCLDLSVKMAAESKRFP